MLISSRRAEKAATLLRLPNPGATEIVLSLTPDARKREELLEDYWSTHPRFLFVKNVPQGARVLDFGAADGGMSVWPGWMHPVRDDISLSAIDIERGARFDGYADYDIVDVTKTRSRFASGSFDAVVCAMTLEYIENARRALAEIARLTRPGGCVFIEYSGEHAVNVPRQHELEKLHLFGDRINFYEDEDHAHLFSVASLDAELRATGFAPSAHGRVRNGRLAPELLNHGLQNANVETTSYGLRLAYGCVSYAIADRLG